MGEIQEKLGSSEVLMHRMITISSLIGSSIMMASLFTARISSEDLYLIASYSLSLICVDWVLTWGTSSARLERFIKRRTPLFLLSFSAIIGLLLHQSILFKTLYGSSGSLARLDVFHESYVVWHSIYFGLLNALVGFSVGLLLSMLYRLRKSSQNHNIHQWFANLEEVVSRLQLQRMTVAVFRKYPERLAGHDESEHRYFIGMLFGGGLALILWLISALLVSPLCVYTGIDAEFFYVSILVGVFFLVFYVGAIQSHLF